MPGDVAHSNSARRAVTIIEFLASRPDQTFSISEIARRVGLNKSTVFTVAHTLYQAGWLYRSPTNLHFGLGPALTVIGTAAAQATPEINLARPVIERLALEVQRECVFSTLVGDDVLVLDTTGPADLGSGWIKPGYRRPCAPPWGTVFVAWQDTASQKDWYERGSVHTPERLAELEADLEAIRQRGFVVTLRSTLHAHVFRVMQHMQDTFTANDARKAIEEGLPEIPPFDYLVGEIKAGTSYEIESIQAPIFELGVPRHALTVNQVHQVLDGDALSQLGRRVRSAADEVTYAIAGMRSAAPGHQ